MVRALREAAGDGLRGSLLVAAREDTAASGGSGRAARRSGQRQSMLIEELGGKQRQGQACFHTHAD